MGITCLQYCVLSHASVKLLNEKKVEEYKIEENDVIKVSKGDVSELEGIIISYEPDFISLDNSNEARAKMPCGHVISPESMTMLMRSLIESKKYSIICPGSKANGQDCLGEWPYDLCRKVGFLTSEEQKEFEVGLSKNYLT